MKLYMTDISGNSYKIRVLCSPGNLEQMQGRGLKALEILSWQLKEHDWLALDRVTIADIACYPYVKRTSEAGLTLEGFPRVQAWLARCEAVPDWLTLDP